MFKKFKYLQNMNKIKSQTADFGKVFFVHVIFGGRRKQNTGLKQSISLLAASKAKCPSSQA